MSTTLHRLYRLAAPQRAPVIEMDLISVEPPPTSAADVPVYGEGRLNASFSAACPSQINTAGVRQLVTAVNDKLHGGFHWFELYLGIALALLLLACAGMLAWEWRERKRKRDEFRTATNLEFNVEPRYLARLLGEEYTPSWVKYPDYDRMGWVNDMVLFMWPNAKTAASAMVRDMAGPLLKQNKPRWISKIDLHTFTLGDVPPRVSGCKVYRRDSLAQQELLVEMDIKWAGNQKFQLKINPLPNLPMPLGIGEMLSKFLGMRVGVSDINIHGRVRLALRPLLNKTPVVGGVKISLVEQPHLSYSIMVQGGDISFLPGLEVFINTLLKDVVLRPYIAPQGFTLPLVPGGGREMPAGVIYVRVIEAVNVPNMDWFSKTDAYVLLWVRGRRKHRTKICWNSLSPRWEEDFQLLVHDPEHQELTTALFNYSTFGADEEIGRVTLPIRELAQGETRDLWLDMGPPKADKKLNPITGTVRRVRQAGRVMTHTLNTVATLGCLDRLTKREPPRLHLEATFYKTGAEEIRAVSQGASAEEVQAAAERGGARDAQRTQRIVNMMRGGILYVKIFKGMDAEESEDGVPRRASQVRVRVGTDEKRTPEAEGKEDPEWEEVLEFAVGGDLVDRGDEQIDVEVWDYHWVNKPALLTWYDEWGPRIGQPEFTGAGWVEVPLREVVERRLIRDVWRLNDVPYGQIEMELQWLPILEDAA